MLLAADLLAEEQSSAQSPSLFGVPVLGQSDSLVRSFVATDASLQTQVSQNRQGGLFTTFDASAAVAASEELYTLVFVDPAVDDYQSLLDGLADRKDDGSSELQVVLFDADRDGVEQMTEVLGGYRNLSAVHVLSHGSSGSLQLGNITPGCQQPG